MQLRSPLIILVIIVFGLGFLVRALLWVVPVLFILWLLGLILRLFRRGSEAARSQPGGP